jgi:hypothetical protein
MSQRNKGFTFFSSFDVADVDEEVLRGRRQQFSVERKRQSSDWPILKGKKVICFQNTLTLSTLVLDKFIGREKHSLV